MRRTKLIKRILEKVKVDDETRCWIWQGATSGKPQPGKTGRGYGKISVDGHNGLVHRVMYTCYHGYIANRIHVDHTCNNRLCCNPDHLEAVTAKENNLRKIKRLKNKKIIVYTC